MNITFTEWLTKYWYRTVLPINHVYWSDVAWSAVATTAHTVEYCAVVPIIVSPDISSFIQVVLYIYTSPIHKPVIQTLKKMM